MKKTSFMTLSAIAAATLVLVGCGGGEGNGVTGSIAGSTNSGVITLYTGESTTVEGSITSDTQLLQSVSWSMQANTPASEKLLLSNDSCAVVNKKDQPFTAPAVVASAGTSRTGSSTWTCNLGVVAPQSVTSDRSYTLILSGKDVSGNTHTQTTKVMVKNNPNPTQNVTNAAGTDFSVTSGDDVPLSCVPKESGATVQWVITNNGGKSIVLSSLTGPSVKFQAPVVQKPVDVTAQCRITYSSGLLEVSNVKVTINPNAATALISNINTSGVVKPGQKLPMTSTTNWVNSAGSNTTGPAITYQWSVPTTAPAGIVFTTPNLPTTDLVIPSSITTATTIPVTMTTTSGPVGSQVTASSTVNVLVDPVGALNPTIDPPASSLKPGEVAKATVNGNASGLYYKWTVVSGPTVPLGGATTNTVSFVAPTVTSETNIVVRAAMGYSPITIANPGLYFVDYVVTVKPAPTTP